MILALLLIADTTVITRVRVDQLEDASVVLQDGKIVSVKAGPITVPNGAKVIVAQGRVLTAGLIEPLSTLGIVEVWGENATRDEQSFAAIAPAFRAGDGFNAASLWIQDAREEGITSAAVTPRGSLIKGTGNWLDLTPRLDPKPLAMFGSLVAHDQNTTRGGMWMKLREVIADARFYKANKKAFDDGRSRDLTLPILQLEALLPVLDGSMLLVLDADRVSDIEAALEFARVEKLRIAISGGAEAWLVREALAKSKVPLIIQPSRQTPSSFDMLRARDDAAAVLNEAGVKLSFTAIAEQWIGRLRQEAGIAVSYGMPYDAALKAITVNTAELYRRDTELGSVKEGKRANVVIWSGDPLELSSIAEHVFIDGVEQSTDTRHKQLARRYLKMDNSRPSR